jgi:ABC-type antimicrobial peptide transport system permease subunit
MLKNYFVTTFRNFARNQSYTLINVVGLSIGITCCIVIFLIVRHDLSFDKFHSRADRTYRAVHDQTNASGIDYSAVTPYPFATSFRNDFPEIPLVTQFHEQGDALIKFGADKFRMKDVLFADSLFFDVLDFKIVSGNPGKELGQKGRAFITKSTAEKFFHGKAEGTFRIENLEDVEIVGIIADPPPTSEIQFSMIVSYPTLTKDFIGFPLDQWGVNSAGYSYMVLPENISEADVENRLVKFVQKYYKKEEDEKQLYHLQPLNEIHFDKNYNSDGAQRSSLVMLAVLGVFILLVACINFINLATALAVKKSKEIGIRKTLGAKRSQLTLYFLGETLMVTLLSVMISLCIVEWMLPWLNNFLDKNVGDSLFTDPTLLPFIVALTLLVTLLSGAYPAIILSGYSPVAVLKNKLTVQNGSAGGVRKVLVAFQFIIAQVLIVGTLVVAEQMSYFRNAPLGFSKDAILNVAIPTNDQEKQESFRTRLSSNSNIKQISFSIGGPVSDNGFGTSFYLPEQGQDQRFEVSMKLVDRNYLETYNLELVAGRWISESEEKLASVPPNWDDRQYVFILNESASKQLGFSNPEDAIGKRVIVSINSIQGPVVGVVKDFHTSSFRDAIKPVILMTFPNFYYDAGIKISSSNMTQTLELIEKAWNDLYPDYFYEYSFMGQYIETLYKQEERTFTLFKVFAGVSIFIACLGLYGLISFMANQKLKEVGIRKVLGASVTSIVMLFSKEFLKLILIAFIIAAPVSWYFMNEWLQSFAYNVNIGWSVFGIAIVVTTVVALATVSYRAVKAAISNPVETLRTE